MATFLRKIYDAIQFDLRKIIFQEITKHAERIIYTHNSKLVNATEKYEKKPIKLNFLYKRLERKHTKNPRTVPTDEVGLGEIMLDTVDTDMSTPSHLAAFE
ncbi:hypothetical protein PVK06_019687 [Gossypium arboreum]|uniref:Uncharacterized protein n=1 Tax=Gossypium arboreum TaxID=29729 RepID=A0ABR0PKE5_GOSAR|nr:hypothetical protein PVK06_019687 [Gossypium arboreum]